jgi:hypothetical protein
MHRARRHTSQETVSIYALCWRFVRQRHKMAPLSLRSLWSAMSLVFCLSHLAANMAPSARLWSRLHVDVTSAISSYPNAWAGFETHSAHVYHDAVSTALVCIYMLFVHLMASPVAQIIWRQIGRCKINWRGCGRKWSWPTMRFCVGI